MPTTSLKGHLIEFDREPIDLYGLFGFALDWTDDLTLLHALDMDTMELNGYSVIRNADVRKWRPRGPKTFPQRAAKLKGIEPVFPAGVSLASWREVLETAGALFPLLALHREKINSRTCHIGRVRSLTEKVVSLKEIDADALWRETRRYRFRDLTKVDFGGGYEEALTIVAADNKKKRS
jgi:hypothetical protein